MLAVWQNAQPLRSCSGSSVDLAAGHRPPQGSQGVAGGRSDSVPRFRSIPFYRPPASTMPRRGTTPPRRSRRTIPERTVLGWELGQALRWALDRLSPEHRAVIELTFGEERSYPEIAAIAGLPGQHRQNPDVPRPQATGPPAGPARPWRFRQGPGVTAMTLLMTDHQTGNPHQDIEELLPWYANGTLTPAERLTVEQHLEQCPACRLELEQCRVFGDPIPRPGRGRMATARRPFRPADGRHRPPDTAGSRPAPPHAAATAVGAGCEPLPLRYAGPWPWKAWRWPRCY